MIDIILKFPREFVDCDENAKLVLEYIDKVCIIGYYSGGSIVAMKECDWWLDYYDVPEYMIIEVVNELQEYGIPSRVEVKINQRR